MQKKINDILNYWHHICQLDPIEIEEDSKNKQCRFSERFILNDKYKLFKYNWKTHDTLLKASEVACGHIDIAYLYERIELSKAEQVETQTGKSFLFVLKINAEGFYKEDSFKIANFVLLMSAMAEDVDLNEKDPMLVDDFNQQINNWLLEKKEMSFTVLKELIAMLLDKLQLKNKIEAEQLDFYIRQSEDDEYDESLMQLDFYSKELKLLMQQGFSEKDFLVNIILASNPNRQKIDDNQDFIRAITHIKYFPLVKWPSKYNPSLMQAVAINIATKSDYPEVFSVNGPPGTGKTTLLKEIIADNIFQRAQIIAKLDPSLKLEQHKIENAKPYYQTYYKIPAELKKLGIIVASNNNAAVENISKDLPKASDVSTEKALTDLFDVSKNEEIYFSKPAQALFSGADTPKTTAEKSTEGTKETIDIWGLISAPYGKSKNIQKILDLLPGGNIPTENKAFTLLNGEMSLDFEQAQKKFNAKLAEVKALQHKMATEIDQIFDLEKRLLQYGSLDKLIEERKNLALEKQHAESELQSLQQNIQNTKERLNLSYRQLSLSQKILHYLFKNNVTINAFNQDLMACLDKQNETNHLLEKVNDAIQKNQERISKFDNYLAITENYRKKYTGTTVVSNSFFTDLQHNAEAQKACPWVCEAWNRLREELFYESLQLTKAFLVNCKGVEQNLKRFKAIMSNSDTGYTADEKKAVFKEGFYTLNLMIPLLSTTFAAVGRAFKDFSKDELGMVIIDEAGQGSPFSSVGLLNRASRCVIVGDPLQVEPVVTVPASLNRLLAERFAVNKETKTFLVGNTEEAIKNYSDTALSIQTLADSANPFYGKIGQTEVGCPLVVHRRCESPMFEISNAISYANRMVKATVKSEKNFVLVNSEFIHVAGKEIGLKNHFVDNQANKVIDLIEEALNRNVEVFDNLKALYIISPFKSVEKGIANKIKSQFKNNKHVARWVNSCIGTVHKFQGKEADSVILLLGCDETSKNAAKWAASQPNILNVAVTRAKSRIVIIGDKTIWGELPNFKESIKILDKH